MTEQSETEVQQEITAADKAKALVSSLRAGKTLHDEFAKVFHTKYLINGKLITEWKSHFQMQIPPDLSPQQLREFGIEILALYQEANFFKLASEAKLQSLKGSSAKSYQENFARIMAEHRSRGERLPAKETLAAMANLDLGDLPEAITHADIELSFWKGVLTDLDVRRKILDTIGISLGVEAKAIQNERYVDALNRKNETY